MIMRFLEAMTFDDKLPFFAVQQAKFFCSLARKLSGDPCPSP